DRSVSLLLVLASLFDTAGGDAVRFLRKVQAAHPADFWATFILAEALDAKKDPDAVGFYRAALALRPRTVAAHVNLGRALSHQGRTAEAMDQWRQALEVDRNSPMAHYNLGVTYADQRLFTQAVEHLRQAIRADSQYGQAYGVLGHSLLNL